MNPTLVILAAGMGTRYGGMKQLETVGPGGETIMDYSIYDALRAGFGKAVFIIRPDMEGEFKETIGRRYEKHIPVAYVFQRLDALPSGFTVPTTRRKPWGTGQALLAAESEVNGPFAAANADDFYGADSYVVLEKFLKQPDAGDVPACAMVGFTLRETLSEVGAVNRGLCRCTPEGWLESIEEVINIERHGGGGRFTNQSGTTQTISGDQLVSMNLWGFQPAVFEQLRERFEGFLRDNAHSDRAEFYLPVGIQELMQAGRARVKVLPTADKWCGVTHQEDKPRVAKMIREMVDRGAYPRNLWK
jgi:dTDP-glucose pyrophosphorylase